MRIGLYGGPSTRSTSATCARPRTRAKSWRSTWWPSCPPRCRRTARRRCRPPRTGSRWCASPRRPIPASRRGTSSCGATGRATRSRRSTRSSRRGPRTRSSWSWARDTWPEIPTWREPRAAAVARRGGGGRSPGLPLCRAHAALRRCARRPARRRPRPSALGERHPRARALGPQRALPGARSGGGLHRRAEALPLKRLPPLVAGAARAALDKKAEHVLALDLRAGRRLHGLLPAASPGTTSASSSRSPTP